MTLNLIDIKASFWDLSRKESAREDTALILAFEHVRHSESLKPFSASEKGE